MLYLTSLRGIAALLVVFYHVRSFVPENGGLGIVHALSAKGYLAVDFFFILSGFVISWRYAAWFEAERLEKLTPYLIRRVARLYPLHVFVLSAYACLAFVLAATGREVPEQFTTATFLAKLFLIDAWLIGTDYWNHWNVPSWTISGEMFAYLLFPFIVKSLRGAITRLSCIGAFVLLAIAAAYEGFDHRSLGDGIGEMGLVRCVMEFSLGVLVYRVYESHTHIRFATVYLLFLVLAAVSLGLALPENHLFIPALFSGILLTSLYIPTSLKRVLEAAPLVWLGDISYSVYLCHTLVMQIFVLAMPSSNVAFDALTLLFYVLVVLLLSHMTHHWIEIPGQKAVRLGLASITARLPGRNHPSQ